MTRYLTKNKNLDSQAGMFGLVVLCMSALFSPPAQAAQNLELAVGGQELVQMDMRIERVSIGNPEVADVNVVNSRQLIVTGKQRGHTSLLVFGRGLQQPKTLRVVVGPKDLPAILSEDKRANVRTQVQADIKIAEVSRSALRQYGFNYLRSRAGSRPGAALIPGTSTGVETPGVNFLSPTGFLPIGDAFNLILANKEGSNVGILSILERRGLMRTLAEPSLVALSGQTASFLAGGEFPIPVTQGGGGNNSITIEFREFGVRLNLTPTVLANDRIVMKVAPEVSELDFSSGVTAAGTTVPGLRIRRADTTVELGDGETFIISGLVSRDLAANVDKIPGLGNIPVLGAFFRSTNFERDDRELIMAVTTTLVKPLAQGTEIEVPGKQYDDYNPSSADILLDETGDFESSTGFTR